MDQRAASGAVHRKAQRRPKPGAFGRPDSAAGRRSRRRTPAGDCGRAFGVGDLTTVYVPDGSRIGTPEDFRPLTAESVYGPGGCPGRNPDSLDDRLRGGFGAPENGDFAIGRRDHEAPRRALGHPGTAR
ncbi:hypothetical protein AB0I68_09105 [Streptomyces sp. NPDC050448]|uniref:hypothetical protein n=1 Tax=Streptomyces sp. NPDC050448 TaxID=3155404 RepID=UPI00343BBD5F